jgi:DNA-binding protein HU-beta
MKKQDFVKAIAAAAGLSQDASSRVLASMIDIITTELKSGGEVNITGFGAFKISKRAARNGVNPKTGESIKIPAMNSPTFKAGKTLKEAVR